MDRVGGAAARAYDIPAARRIDDPTLYVGKFITDRETKIMAFRNETSGQFIGEITEPKTATWHARALVLSHEAEPSPSSR